MNLTKTAPFLFFLFGFYCLTVKGQTSSSGIIQKLQKLNTIGSVLYIAAHPDDENTRLLTYMANERKMRTAYLSITRGDGGQNLIGKEQGEPLGLIRKGFFGRFGIAEIIGPGEKLLRPIHSAGCK